MEMNKRQQGRYTGSGLTGSSSSKLPYCSITLLHQELHTLLQAGTRSNQRLNWDCDCRGPFRCDQRKRLVGERIDNTDLWRDATWLHWIVCETQKWYSSSEHMFEIFQHVFLQTNKSNIPVRYLHGVKESDKITDHFYNDFWTYSPHD